MIDDMDKQIIVAKAGLLSKGWIEETKGGMQLTPEGYRVAYSRWMNLSDETKALLCCLIRETIDQIKR